MQKKTGINLIKGDKAGSETDYRDFLPVNMTAVIRPMFTASGYMLQWPGLTQYGTVSGVARGALWNERFLKHFRVAGSDLIEVSEDGTVTVLGAIPGAETVSLPYSFNTQGIVASGRFFLSDPSNGFQEVTSPNLGTPIDCVWVDGFYFFTDGEFLYHTSAGDETVIDPLQQATAEFMPDESLGVGKTQDNKVVVFGRFTVEFFVNQATDNFAFRRVDSRAIKVGIVGTHCKFELDFQWYILGGRKDEAVSVHVLGVGSAVKVATREIEKIINQYNETELSSVVLEGYSENAYSFLIVHLPNECLIFNKTIAEKLGIEQAWSILRSDVTGVTPWRAKHGLFEPRKGKWVYGDKVSTQLGFLDDSITTHYGELTEWLLGTPYMFLDSDSIDEIAIETIPGYTATDDATVFLSLTYDGASYGQEWVQVYGLPYKRQTRFIVRRLGYVSDWVGFKLRGATRSRMAFGRGYIEHG